MASEPADITIRSSDGPKIQYLTPDRTFEPSDTDIIVGLGQVGIEEGASLEPIDTELPLRLSTVPLEEGAGLGVSASKMDTGVSTVGVEEGDSVDVSDASMESGVGEVGVEGGDGVGVSDAASDIGLGAVSFEGPFSVPWMPDERTYESLSASSLSLPARPAFYLNFDEPHDLPKRIKDGWQRGTEATYWDGEKLRTAAPHEPRVQVDPETGERYLLAEPQRTNLLLNSDTLNGQTVTVSDATTYTLSFWGGGDVTLSNAHSKTLSGSGSSTRTTYTFTTAGTTLGVSVSGTVENAQIEQGNFPTSYISNGGSQTTRAADDLSDLPFSMQSGAKSVYFRLSQEANGYAPNEGGNVTNAEANLTDTPGTAGGGLLRPSTGILGISADGWVDAVVNSTDEDLQGNSTSDVVDGLTIQPDKDPSTDGAIYRIHELVAWEEERTYDERRSLTDERPQPWQELDAPNINTLDTLGGDIDWSTLGISEPPHLNIDIPRFGIPAKMRSAWQRDTVATYWDSNGVLQTAQAGEPRLARLYDGSQWKTEGVLAEPQRTNILVSRDPSQWGDFGGIVGYESGIDGSQNATRLEDTSNSKRQRVSFSKIISGSGVQGVTYSVFVKKEGSADVYPEIQINTNNNNVRILAYLNPATGEVEFRTLKGKAEVESWGDWWRVVLTVNIDFSVGGKVKVYLFPAGGGSNLSKGDGTETGATVFDAPQVERHHAVATDANGNADATHATMPILTGGATRSEDKLVMPVWWPQGIVSGGYYEAYQFAGGEYKKAWQNSELNVAESGKNSGSGLTAYDEGIASRFSGGSSFYRGGVFDRYPNSDGLGYAASNTDDAYAPEEVRYLEIRTGQAYFILRRLYLWPQELTEGSSGQLKALFDHDFSV